jgi:hypothetical protein
MKREHMPHRYMSQFKAFFADYEFYLSLSDKPVSVCLTERQMYIMSVWNSYTPWMTRWYNTEDTSAQQLAVIAAEIENLLMCGCGMPAPTITDRLNTNVYNTETSTTYINNITTYNTDGDTLNTLAPNMTYAGGTAANIDKMLCLGYEMMLRAIVEQGIQVLEMDEEQQTDLVRQIGAAMAALASAGGLALTVGGFAATVVGIIGGPWALLGLAIGGIAVGISSLFVSVDTSVLTDSTAFEQVLCTLRENSLGKEPSQAVFSGLLTPNLFAAGSNAEKLASVVQPFLNDLSFYLQFMMSMSDLYDTSLLAELPDCVTCVTPITCAGRPGYDFRIASGGFLPYVNRATYVPGQGWTKGVLPATPTRIGIWRTVTPHMTSVTVVTKGNVDAVRVYSSTGGVIGSLIGQSLSPTVVGDQYTWNIATLGAFAGNEVMFDLGGGSDLVGKYFKWFCYN